jgi:phage terminase large subunit
VPNLETSKKNRFPHGQQRRIDGVTGVLDIKTPAIFEPLLAPARYKGAYGGRGSAKSHFFADQLIDDSLVHPGLRTVCIREYQVSLEQSVKRLLEDKINGYGLTNQFRVMDSRIETPGDGIVIFQGMQSYTAQSIKSLEGYHRAWVEEAQSLSQRSLELLRPTIREPGSELWFSWNPGKPTDPVDALLRGSVLPPGAVVVRSSYRDNPFFPSELQREMEWDRTRDPEKYAHVWLGEYEKHSESRVFKNWRVAEFESPDDAAWMVGADWGFSVDPSTMTRVRAQDRTLFVDSEAYALGCEIDHLPELFDGLVCGCKPQQPHPCRHPSMHGWARAWESVADSARPETISYLKNHGYPRMVAAKKGPDSVKEGVIFLQGYDIVLHPRCVHTIDEFTLYSYKVDKLTGVATGVLEDKKNHIIDPIRYAIEKMREAVSFVTW